MDASENSIVADSGLPARLAAAYLRWEFSRRRWAFTWVCAGLTVIVAISASIAQGTLSLLWFGALFVGTIGGILVFSYVTARTSVARAHPEGSVISVAVGEDGLSYESAMGRGEIRFAALRAVHATPEAVFVRLFTSPVTTVFPRAAFTDDDLARLQREATAGR